MRVDTVSGRLFPIGLTNEVDTIGELYEFSLFFGVTIDCPDYPF